MEGLLGRPAFVWQRSVQAQQILLRLLPRFSWRVPINNDYWAKAYKKSKQGQFQIVDVVQLFSPICKFTKQIVDGGNIPRLFEKPLEFRRKKNPGRSCSNYRKILPQRRPMLLTFFLPLSDFMQLPAKMSCHKPPN